MNRNMCFILGLVFFVCLAKCVHESLSSPEFFDWWWIGGFVSLVGYDQTVRLDERLKYGIKTNKKGL